MNQADSSPMHTQQWALQLLGFGLPVPLKPHCLLPAARVADTACAGLLTPQEEARLREMAIREEKTKELLRNKDGLGPAARKKSVKAPWGSPGGKGNAASLSMERLNHYQAACDKVMQGTGARSAGVQGAGVQSMWLLTMLVTTRSVWLALCRNLGQPDVDCDAVTVQHQLPGPSPIPGIQ